MLVTVGTSDELKRKIAEALAQEKIATREDLLDDNFSGLTLSPDFSAYFNVRTTLLLDGLTASELTHLKFTPMTEDGVVVAQAAVKGELGAEEFVRTETRRSGSINMRAALHGFDLEWTENRNLLLPVSVDEIPLPGGAVKKVIMISVKRPKTKERIKRTRKSPTPPPKDTEAPKTEPAAGAQPPEDEQNA